MIISQLAVDFIGQFTVSYSPLEQSLACNRHFPDPTSVGIVQELVQVATTIIVVSTAFGGAFWHLLRDLR